MLTFCRLYVCMKQYIQYFTARIYNVPSNTWSFNLITHQKCKCTSGCLPLLLSIESSLIRQETARRKEKTTKKYFNWNPDFNSDLPSKVYSASITRWVLQTEVELLQITSQPRDQKRKSVKSRNSLNCWHKNFFSRAKSVLKHFLSSKAPSPSPQVLSVQFPNSFIFQIISNGNDLIFKIFPPFKWVATLSKQTIRVFTVHSCCLFVWTGFIPTFRRIPELYLLSLTGPLTRRVLSRSERAPEQSAASKPASKAATSAASKVSSGKIKAGSEESRIFRSFYVSARRQDGARREEGQEPERAEAGAGDRCAQGGRGRALQALQHLRWEWADWRAGGGWHQGAWSKCLDASSNGAGVGEVLQMPLLRLCHAPLAWSNPLLCCLQHPGETLSNHQNCETWPDILPGLRLRGAPRW